MYAIRSYYADVLYVPNGVEGFDDYHFEEAERLLQTHQVGRITSYNVCYTKLLRMLVLAAGHPVVPGEKRVPLFQPKENPLQATLCQLCIPVV